jgi:hypothetical protein
MIAIKIKHFLGTVFFLFCFTGGPDQNRIKLYPYQKFSGNDTLKISVKIITGIIRPHVVLTITNSRRRRHHKRTSDSKTGKGQEKHF